MEHCTFCDNLMYDNISMDSDWRISMLKDNWDKRYYLNIEHDVYLGDFGTQDFSTEVMVNYCPVCGRNLIEGED